MTEEVDIPEEQQTQGLVARGELAQIQGALLAAMLRIPEMDTTQTAELWRAVDIISRDLAAMRRDASNHIVELAPRESYKYRGEARDRPVKQQVVPEVGVVLIENTATRTWKDLRSMAHEMAQDWSFAYAASHDGNMPTAKDMVDFVFNVFAVGDPRTTVMKELGLGRFDDEPWVAKSFAARARVL